MQNRSERDVVHNGGGRPRPRCRRRSRCFRPRDACRRRSFAYASRRRGEDLDGRSGPGVGAMRRRAALERRHDDIMRRFQCRYSRRRCDRGKRRIRDVIRRGDYRCACRCFRRAGLDCRGWTRLVAASTGNEGNHYEDNADGDDGACDPACSESALARRNVQVVGFGRMPGRGRDAERSCRGWGGEKVDGGGSSSGVCSRGGSHWSVRHGAGAGADFLTRRDVVEVVRWLELSIIKLP